MSETDFVDQVVLGKMAELTEGAACCADVLERELGFDPGEAIARLLEAHRLEQARGCCAHCSSMLFQAVAQAVAQ